MLEDGLDGVLALNVLISFALLLERLHAVLESDDATADKGKEVFGSSAEIEDELGKVEEGLLASALHGEKGTTASDTLKDDNATFNIDLLFE